MRLKADIQAELDDVDSQIHKILTSALEYEIDTGATRVQAKHSSLAALRRHREALQAELLHATE